MVTSCIETTGLDVKRNSNTNEENNRLLSATDAFRSLANESHRHRGKSHKIFSKTVFMMYSRPARGQKEAI